MARDFRGYLDYLERKEKLVRVKKEVDVRHEIAAGIRKASDTDGPALLFENIKGYPGWQVVGGVYATKTLMALALRTEPDEDKMLQRYLEVDQKRIKPKLVPTGPVKEIIIKGDDVDLTELPIPIYCEKDCGPYIIGCADIAKHPDTGIQNVSIDRRLLLGKDRTALACPPPQHLGTLIMAAEEKGQGLGIATVLGPPPELTLASQVKVPLGIDETEIAGGFGGEALEVVKCETIDVEVPADAEIVIEGVTIPGERVSDGPFGEYPGDYISLTGTTHLDCFVVKVTAITMRKHPIFQAMATGMPMTENHWLKKWAIAAAAYREVSKIVPYPDDIKGINLTEGGANCNLVVAIRKRTERTPRDIIYTLLAARLLLWNVIVVDDDVDVYNPLDVERAWATRVIPEQDIIILPSGIQGGDVLFWHKKWGIDATMPIQGREWASKARVPGVEKVDYW